MPDPSSGRAGRPHRAALPPHAWSRIARPKALSTRDVTSTTIETTVRKTNLGLSVRTSVLGAIEKPDSPDADLALLTILAVAACNMALTTPLGQVGLGALARSR